MSVVQGVIAAASLACIAADPGPAQSAKDMSRLGGPATIDSREPNAFGLPAPGLDALGRRAFVVGNSFFRDNWVAPPASAAGRDGLGPLFNARSCSACHEDDGRGRPPLENDERATGMVVRISPRDADGKPHPIYGDQIQDQAVMNAAPEAAVVLRPRVRKSAYPDGDAFELTQWDIALDSPAYGPVGEARLSVRIGQQLVGVGLLEAVDAATIAELADPDDRDHDGVSGRPNMVVDPRTGSRELGRFGWKAGRPDLESQIAGALREDIGITSSVFPDESTTAAERGSIKAASGGSPEIDDFKLQRLAHYCRVLAVPAQRDSDDAAVRRGAELFASAGCVACHAPLLRTGKDSPIAQFRDVVIHPYTDLLLHDMGPDLADDRSDGEATGREWRTPPLWGIGLIETVNRHTRFLHDGRARSIEEAVLWHGGEAEAARRRFMAMPRADRAALLAFLQSL